MRPGILFSSPENHLLATLFFCVAMLVGPTALADDDIEQAAAPLYVKLSTGLDFSRGDYGLDDNTSLYYFPFSVTFDYQRFRMRAALPILVSSGPTQINETNDVTASGQTRGIGQLQLDFSYLFEPADEAVPHLEIAAKVSAPTESRRDLGTGLWAFALQAEMFKQSGRFTPYLNAGRKFYESCGCSRSLRDRFFASAGVTYEWTSNLSVGIGYDWLQAARRGTPDSLEVVPYALYRLSDRWSVGPYAVIGLSNGSPDYGFGFSLSVRQ